jgi:ferritin
MTPREIPLRKLELLADSPSVSRRLTIQTKDLGDQEFADLVDRMTAQRDTQARNILLRWHLDEETEHFAHAETLLRLAEHLLGILEAVKALG